MPLLQVLVGLTFTFAVCVSAVPSSPSWSGYGILESPNYPWIFQYPLPIPPIAVPKYTETVNGTVVNYFEMSIEKFQKQVYPNLGPANMAGYNSTSPGPTFWIKRGEQSVIRLTNNNDLSASMHLHGATSRSPWDGWANDMIQPGQFKDYYYAESQTARTLWYHDHADKHTAVDAYFGQTGFHVIHDPAEDALGLPSGPYDLVLSIMDRQYQYNGDLVSPAGNIVNFFGDVIEVNGQPWPYMAVEPRKYRLRFLNNCLSRPFELYFADSRGDWQNMNVIGSDAGLFGAPVSTTTLDMGMAERYEVVFDFANFTNQNITLGNNLQIPDIQQFTNTDKVMSFVVGNKVTNSSNNQLPGTLVDQSSRMQQPPQPYRTQVDHVFNFQKNADNWTINGVTYSDITARILARPPMGTVENWQLRYAAGPGVHPVHIHLIDFQIVSRTGGRRTVLPYEAAGLKDVVLLEPGEVVNVVAVYGPWNGMYQFHCHNLIHEDHEMMDVFNTTVIADLGYDLQDVLAYDDPLDPRFAAQDVGANQQDFAPTYITKTVLPNFVNCPAYQKQSQVVSAESAYYATVAYGETPTPTPAAAGIIRR